MDLKEELAKAGSMYDGHVTHGSLEEQIAVVNRYIAKILFTCEEKPKTVMSFIHED